MAKPYFCAVLLALLLQPLPARCDIAVPDSCSGPYCQGEEVSLDLGMRPDPDMPARGLFPTVSLSLPGPCAWSLRLAPKEGCPAVWSDVGMRENSGRSVERRIMHVPVPPAGGMAEYVLQSEVRLLCHETVPPEVAGGVLAYRVRKQWRCGDEDGRKFVFEDAVATADDGGTGVWFGEGVASRALRSLEKSRRAPSAGARPSFR